MRSGLAVPVLLACLGLLVGCQSDPPAAIDDPGVTTPPAFTAPTQPSTQPRSPGGGGTPVGTTPAPPTPLATYQALVSDWQRARSAFFADVTSGRPLTLGQEHTLAARYLGALRRLGSGLRTNRWPAPARPATRELLAANAQQQTHLVAMTQAPSRFAFTQRLADYGVDAARENRAVAAVSRALGG